MLNRDDLVFCRNRRPARGLNARVSNESAPRGPRLHAPSRARQDSVWGQRQRVNRNAPIPSAWVRWNYFCANKDDDSRPALRGT